MTHLSNLRLLFCPVNHYPAAAASPLFLSPLRYKSSSKLSLFFKPKIQFPLRPAHPINIPAEYKLPLLFNLCASYSKRTSSDGSYSRSPSSRIKHRRSNSSLSGSDRKNNNTKQKGGVAMDFEEGSDSSVSVEPNVGFNRKRALGRDKNDTAKRNLQLKVRKLNPVNTICYVQILGTGMDTQDTSPSVLLFFDKQRFIFNAGEGLQRYCTEHKIKLSKIDHIFFSRVCSETAGGLPGLLLTLAGMGDEGMSVNIWGPSDLEYLVGAMRSFIPNAAMVHTRCFGPASNSKGGAGPSSANVDNPLVLVDDEVVKLSAILLRSSCSKVNHLLDSDAKVVTASNPGDLSAVYICELPEIKGKFDPNKAVALGLKAGPKYRELQLGNSVKSDRQDIMVHPDDVMGPSVPGPIVILVDCPTLSHLKHLLSIQALTDYYTNAPSNSSCHASKLVNCVIHLSPSHVTSTSEYQEWMTRFSEAQHIMAGHEAKNIEVPILKSSARIAARLNYLCPQFFPAPGFWSLQHLKNIPPAGLRSLSECTSSSKSSERILAENLLKFHLRPYSQLGLDRSMVPDRTSLEEIIDELVLELPEIKDASQQVNQLMLGCGTTPIKEEEISERAGKMFIEEPWLHENAVASCLENVTREDMEIVLLGTGSSQPSKYRNVSSIFINLFSKGSVLFDCGEGTLGQLKRRFGVHGADDAVRGLRCIWISHIHADHHTGLARILTRRRDLLKGVPHEPLVVVGPIQLKRFLDAYQRLEDLDMQFLDCRHTTADELDAFDEPTPTPDDSVNNGNEKDADSSRLMDEKIDTTLFAKGNRMQSVWKRPGSPVDNAAVVYPILKSLMKELREAGLEALISFPVIHCPQSFGVVLKAADRVNSSGKTIPGWKIAYSGDTRPCPELVKASHGATVLIHEATFEDSMIEEAISRNHSTTAEAIEAGDSAGAYRIILTHFSQRYPKIPVFDESHMHKTCIAFDMMSVNLADLPVLPKVLPYLKMLFRDEMSVDESDDVVNVETAVA